MKALTAPTIPGLTPLHEGKVRVVFSLDAKTLLLVASDRLSAFDCILPSPIPGKGRVLTELSRFWFDTLSSASPHHCLGGVEALPGSTPESVRLAMEGFGGRAMVCRRLDMVPYECVVRGRLAGSAWRSYRERGEVGGHRLPAGLELGDPLPEPLFTPTTKAATGHDEPVSFAGMAAAIGDAAAEELRERSLRLFAEAREHCEARGLLLADTKFEFGRPPEGGALILADEVLTPDSSRFYRADEHRRGEPVKPWDKQVVRDWLEQQPWDKSPPAPALPEELIDETRRRYEAILELVTGPAAG